MIKGDFYIIYKKLSEKSSGNLDKSDFSGYNYDNGDVCRALF